MRGDRAAVRDILCLNFHAAHINFHVCPVGTAHYPLPLNIYSILPITHYTGRVPILNLHVLFFIPAWRYVILQ